MLPRSPESILNADEPIPCSPARVKHQITKSPPMMIFHFKEYTLENRLEPPLEALRSLKYTQLDMDTRTSGTTVETFAKPLLELFNNHLMTDGNAMTYMPPTVPPMRLEHVQSDPCDATLFTVGVSKDQEWSPSAFLTGSLKKPPRTIDWQSERKCLAVTIFISPNIIRWDDIIACKNGEVLKSNPATFQILDNIRTISFHTNCGYGIVSDGTYSLLFHNQGPNCPYTVVEILSTSLVSVRILLFLTIYQEASKSRMFPGRPIANICRGALPEEARSEADIHSGLRGFDFYTLQRSPELWTSLCRWKEDVLEQADYHSPVAGDSLTVRVHEFGRREFLWRSPLPHPAIPNDTLHIITQNKRPRSLEADKILASKPTLSFEITQSVRTGHNYFSQVFFGRLAGTDTPLCLKLFDERLFRMPAPPKGSQSPLRRLSDMNFADDMMRREEAVYTRLSYLQGSAIPHCYGFHSFILPDGYNAWGMFLEIIDGVSLADVKLSSKNVDVQRDFLTRVRHTLRAFNFASIEQSDWHGEQIICTTPPKDLGSTSPFKDVVFIDFAFTNHRLGETTRLAPLRMEGHLKYMLMFNLSIDMKLLQECWIPKMEEEY